MYCTLRCTVHSGVQLSVVLCFSSQNLIKRGAQQILGNIPVNIPHQSCISQCPALNQALRDCGLIASWGHWGLSVLPWILTATRYVPAQYGKAWGALGIWIGISNSVKGTLIPELPGYPAVSGLCPGLGGHGQFHLWRSWYAPNKLTRKSTCL